MYRYQKQVESENEKALTLHIPTSQLFATPYGIFWQVYLKSSAYCEVLTFYFCFLMSYKTQESETRVQCLHPHFILRHALIRLTFNIVHQWQEWPSPLVISKCFGCLPCIWMYINCPLQFIYSLVVLESGPLRTSSVFPSSSETQILLQTIIYNSKMLAAFKRQIGIWNWMRDYDLKARFTF